MKKALIKLTGRLWPLEGFEVGAFVKAELDTEIYNNKEGVYVHDRYVIFTKPDPYDKFENDWAGEIVGRDQKSDYSEIFGREPEDWREPLGALRITLYGDPEKVDVRRAQREVEELVRVLNGVEGKNE